MFATAQLDGLIARNPVPPHARMSLPRKEKPDIVPLTVAQVQAWADCADPRVRPMILAQAGPGLRVSELRALRVEDVDFLRRVVRVTAQLHNLSAERVPLKTANSRRDVPLPAMVADVLASHIKPGQPGLIFTRTATGHWGNAVLGKKYREAAEAAGLPPDTTSHDLRHHYASVLLDAGESVHAVAVRIGDSPEMVLRVYGHMMPDREDATRRAVDAAWQVTNAVRQAGVMYPRCTRPQCSPLLRCGLWTSLDYVTPARSATAPTGGPDLSRLSPRAEPLRPAQAAELGRSYDPAAGALRRC